MNEKDFLENYLWPSENRLDRTFTHPLPNIEGLKKCGDFLVQSEHEDTFLTSIITKYEGAQIVVDTHFIGNETKTHLELFH